MKSAISQAQAIIQNGKTTAGGIAGLLVLLFDFLQSAAQYDLTTAFAIFKSDPDKIALLVLSISALFASDAKQEKGGRRAHR